MTYNFDPERWYADRHALLERRRGSGELDETGFAAAVASLEADYRRMVERLDGTYQLPPDAGAPVDARSPGTPGAPGSRGPGRA
jgi:hypothetical protein